MIEKCLPFLPVRGTGYRLTMAFSQTRCYTPYTWGVADVVYLARKTGGGAMNFRKVWLLRVSVLLVCGLIGCREKPQPVVEKPEAVPEEPRSLAGKSDATAESSVEFTNSIGMRLRLIPAGEFMMGSPDNGMAPEHKIRITKPFYIGVYEVTQGEYKKLMGENPSSFSKGGSDAEDVSGEDTSSHPVENVRWEDAVEFCKRLSTKEGKTYRLPTEAEWEYACRAGTTTQYSFGDDEKSLGEYVWYTGNSEDRSHSVGEKKPNSWGLHDMHGNVWEWCADWYGLYVSEEVSDPSGPEMGTSRVIRGGCWGSAAETCRAAFRFGSEPWNRNDDLGFRVAAVP